MRRKVVTIVGARPQFIKCSPLSKVLRSRFQEVLVHTGQHYDDAMSRVFFEELHIPPPDHHLGVGSGSHAEQTGNMLIGLEQVLQRERPDLVVVFGDTNSTLAGALAAAKLHMPVAHVEAGVRSFNRAMPEEINRVATDHVSDLLFCPTGTAMRHLKREGIEKGAHQTGDVMYDAVLAHREEAKSRSRILEELGLSPKAYYLATVHRPGNTEDPSRLLAILEAFEALSAPVVFPMHPRTREAIADLGVDLVSESTHSEVRMMGPVSYLDMLVLTESARKVLTDSGGLQKEAYFLGVPSLILRSETEWVELVQGGASILVGADREAIVEAAKQDQEARWEADVFGDGKAADHMTERIEEFFAPLP